MRPSSAAHGDLSTCPCIWVSLEGHFKTQVTATPIKVQGNLTLTPDWMKTRHADTANEIQTLTGEMTKQREYSTGYKDGGAVSGSAL